MQGDLSDIVFRLWSALPKGWFTAQGPNLTAILTALATPWVWLYNLLDYVQAQTRVATATDIWLDIASQDYLGQTCLRNPSESDNAYRSRIKSALLCGAATRNAISNRIEQLTGTAPIIFEPAKPSDTGAYGTLHAASANLAPSGLAYGLAGGWGSMEMPYQFFMTVTRTIASDAANITGYGSSGGGYGVGCAAYLDLTEIQGQLTDQYIQSAICSLLPVNGIAWIRIN